MRGVHRDIQRTGLPINVIDKGYDELRSWAMLPPTLRVAVHRINSEEFGVKDFSQVKVTCYTCHRGAKKPETFPPAPSDISPAPMARSRSVFMVSGAAGKTWCSPSAAP